MINHRAQVPGYCGYIPGKNSQNVFGRTFGEVTKGSLQTQNQSFLTTNVINNTFIQKQHQSEHQFWGNQGKISAFEEPKKKQINNTHRIPQQKFVPQKLSSLTYQQARTKKI